MPTMLSASMRDMLIQHLDGNGVLWIRNSQCLPSEERGTMTQLIQTRNALIERQWIRFDARERKPDHTYITDVGRYELAKTLADWTEETLRRAERAVIKSMAARSHPPAKRPDREAELLALFKEHRRWMRTKSEQAAEESFA